MLKYCPNCGENLSRFTKPTTEAVVMNQKNYDQTAIWKQMVEVGTLRQATPPSPEELVSPIVEGSREVFRDNKGPTKSVVHLLFNDLVVPSGGVLYHAALSEGRFPVEKNTLVSKGYVFDDDKIMMVDNIPVGRGYQIISYWGGERQHSRWHLASPVKLNPSRNGNPYFMDDNMVAFGATWKDGGKLEEALLELVHLFLGGIQGEGRVADPTALAVFWQGAISGIRIENPKSLGATYETDRNQE